MFTYFLIGGVVLVWVAIAQTKPAWRKLEKKLDRYVPLNKNNTPYGGWGD